MEEARTPKEILDRVLQSGQSERYTARGYTYEISASQFPNGAPCTSTRIVDGPGEKGWHWNAIRTGFGDTIMDALQRGLVAEPQEVEGAEGTAG
jgi:hypothetical protein